VKKRKLTPKQRRYADAPRRVYLQHDPENTGEPFHAACEVTWAQHRIYRSDIEYIRADLARRLERK
jgi:hypothetical protein